MLRDTDLCTQLSCGLVLGGVPRMLDQESCALFVHLLITLKKSRHLYTLVV